MSSPGGQPRERDRICRSSRAPRDACGLELSAAAPAAEVYLDALRRLLCLETGAEDLLAQAIDLDPNFALAHAVLATAQAERGAPSHEVRRHLHAAGRRAHRTTEREASFIRCATRWCTEDPPGDAGLVRHVRSWPHDTYAVALLTPSIASAGVTDGVVEVWGLLDELDAGHGDDWWLLSMRAFARTEQGQWSEAEDLAGAALDRRPEAGHAAHALAHVHYETGRHSEAVRWLDDWLAGPGRRQQFRGHFAWHAALVELANGDVLAVRRRFDQELAGLAGCRLLVDSGSLLARMAVHGRPLGADRTRAVSEATDRLTRRPHSPFVAWNAAALAGIRGDTERLAAIEEQAEDHAGRAVRRHPTAAGPWRQVVTVCRAMRAFAQDEPALTASLLGSLGDTSGLGGSSAQRELLEDVALRCLRAAGEGEAAARVAAGRLARRPSSFDTELCAAAARPDPTLEATQP